MHCGAVQGAVDQQAAGVDVGSTGKGVVASQQQRSGAGFVQYTSAGKVAGVGAVNGLLEGQRRVVGDGALQAGGVARGGAAVERGTAAVGVGTCQQQGAAAVFHQAASAADHAIEGQVVAAGQGQRATQVEGIGQLQVGAAIQLRRAADRQGTTAQGSIIAKDQLTGVQASAAAVAVDAIERQRCRTVFHQAAAAADATVEGQRVAACHRQGTVEYSRIGQADRRVAVQGGAAGRRQSACAEGTVVAHHQGAAIQRGTAGVAIIAVEYQGATVELGQGASAVEGHAQGRGGVRVDAHRGVAGAAIDQVEYARCASAQGVAIGDELHAGDVLRAVHRHVARRALEHREAVDPALVEGAVDIGPVGIAGVPGAVAAVNRTVADQAVAIPELHGGVGCSHQQADLAGDRGLHLQITRYHTAWQCAERQAVIGQGPGVVDEVVDAAAKAADIGDIEVTVQSQVAADIQQASAAAQHRGAEANIQVRVATQHQRAHRQCAAGGQADVPTVGHGHRAGQ